jgi:hypothetical protein
MKRSNDGTAKQEEKRTLRSLMCSLGGPNMAISDDRLREELCQFLSQLGEQDDVFLVPPDFTRFHSQAGKITEMIAQYYQFIPGGSSSDDSDSTTTITTNKPPSQFQIMPALGTHAPMTQEQIQTMFGKSLAEKHAESNSKLFQIHDWRNDVVTIGEVPADMVATATRGMVHRPWPAQLNQAIWEKKNKPKSVVLSIGQGV